MEKLRDFLVTDRTAEDVAAGNGKGTYHAEDLNRVLRACAWLAGRLEERGYRVDGEFFPAALVSAAAAPAVGGRVRGALGYIGETVTVRAEPEENFRFLGWQEDGETVSSSLEYSFIAERDRDLAAVFENAGRDTYGVAGVGRAGLARAGWRGE